jgi:conjugative transposon TraN protein
VQKVKETQNVLLVKAASVFDQETNLSVLTSDGGLYSFAVCYDSTPPLQVYHFPMVGNQSEVMLDHEGLTPEQVKLQATGLLDNPSMLSRPKDSKWGMKLRVTGVYIRENVMFLQLRLLNLSPITYDVDLLNLFIRDRKKNKRTAVQEKQIIPLHTAGDIQSVPSNGTTNVVLAVPRFTIPDAQYLDIEVMEKRGGRHLQLKVGNRTLIKAQALPSVK